MPPRISIVTPSYNQAQYLEECIDSVLSQRYPNIEYVIMDGGSTDGSVEIIKKYEKHLSYWQSCPDDGQYAAVNAGFSRTSGEIMAWLNSDDRYHPNAFLKVASAFSTFPHIEWLTGIRTVWGSKGEINHFDHTAPYFSRGKYFSGNFNAPYIQQESTFWRRELWEKAGGALNTKCALAADAELWLRFFRFTVLYSIKAFLGGFRYHANQRSIQNLRQYEQEIQNEISSELEHLDPDTKLNKMPEQLYITTETYKSFAKKFSIPLFSAYDNPQWQNYFHTVSNWILERHDAIEAAPFFFDEISLWFKQRNNLPTFLLKKLRKQIALRDKASQLITKGERLYHAGDLDRALKATLEALDISPTSADGNNNLGVFLYHNGKIKEAIERLMVVLQYEVSKREVYRNLAVIFHKLGQMDMVKWAHDNYLEQFPEDTEMELFYRRLMEWH